MEVIVVEDVVSARLDEGLFVDQKIVLLHQLQY